MFFNTLSNHIQSQNDKEIINKQKEIIEILKEKVKLEKELTQAYRENNIELQEQVKKLFALIDESTEIIKKLAVK